MTTICLENVTPASDAQLADLAVLLKRGQESDWDGVSLSFEMLAALLTRAAQTAEAPGAQGEG
ncbi:hypothetical protein [Rhodovarius lipocyclicus]|uniref:hypothetical protein n=1 Tax=Rhodovarius lipocyclicus TaxID=268410 RepID=UPI0013583CA6|nr:hypothetical protein [Rhodovarius lipocyclicus]